jgi:hypothetical protein
MDFDPLPGAERAPEHGHARLAWRRLIASNVRRDDRAAPSRQRRPIGSCAEWWIRKPHVERRLAARTARAAGHFIARSADVAKAPSAIATRQTSEWLECLSADASLDAPRIAVPIPPRFTELQQQATDAALAWRLHDARNLSCVSLARLSSGGFLP